MMARSTLVLTTLLIGLVLPPATVWAQNSQRAQCLDAYEANQRLRHDGKLTQARDKLLICVAKSCPKLVRPDCIRWLSEVEQQLPSIVIAAKDVAGADTMDVAVFIDGEQVAKTIDGRPIFIDPGPHAVRFVHKGKSTERSLVVQQGVKSRIIEVSFQQDEVASEVASEEPREAAAVDKGQPVAAYVFGGLSVLAFASFGVFGLMGKSEADELNGPGGCGETDTCSSDELSAVRTKLIVADVSLGAGVAFFGVGLGLFIYHHVSDPEPSTSAIRWGVGPTVGGAAGLLAVPF